MATKSKRLKYATPISLQELREGAEEWATITYAAVVTKVSRQAIYLSINEKQLVARSFFGLVLVDMRVVQKISRRRYQHGKISRTPNG